MVTGYRDHTRREDMKPEQGKENVKKRTRTRRVVDTFEPDMEVETQKSENGKRLRGIWKRRLSSSGPDWPVF